MSFTKNIQKINIPNNGMFDSINGARYSVESIKALTTLGAVLDGNKPFGVVELDKEPALYSLVSHNAHLLDVRMHDSFELAYSLKGKESYKPHIAYLNILRLGDNNLISRAYYQSLMGKLFGYPKEDILNFIKTNTCTCRKCGGHIPF